LQNLNGSHFEVELLQSQVEAQAENIEHVMASMINRVADTWRASNLIETAINRTILKGLDTFFVEPVVDLFKRKKEVAKAANSVVDASNSVNESEEITQKKFGQKVSPQDETSIIYNNTIAQCLHCLFKKYNFLNNKLVSTKMKAKKRQSSSYISC